MLRQVIYRGTQRFQVFKEETKSSVAFTAQQPTNITRDMIVVDSKSCGGFSTDSASSTLLGKNPVVFLTINPEPLEGIAPFSVPGRFTYLTDVIFDAEVLDGLYETAPAAKSGGLCPRPSESDAVVYKFPPHSGARTTESLGNRKWRPSFVVVEMDNSFNLPRSEGDFFHENILH